MDALGAARRWADGWSRAWRTHDTELVARLYADAAIFRSQPFRPPEEPAAYAHWAFEGEASVRCWFSEPTLVAGERAVVEYWAVSTSREGDVETIAGVGLLRFDAEGRVIEEREYWNTASGAMEPSDGWASK